MADKIRIFAAHDGGSGCAWYRVISPLEELARHDGFEVTFKGSQAKSSSQGEYYNTITARDLIGYDLIVGQRFNSYKGLPVWRSARTPYNRLVYEIDDDVFNITQENFAAYQLYQREDIQDATIHCAETSDLVTVSTPHLAQVMGEFNPKVAVLGNYVPESVLSMQRSRRDRPCIGWCGGASHGRDIHVMLPSVRRFLKRHRDWDLHLTGTDYRASVKAGDQAIFSQWVHITDDPAAYFASIDFDIALAPLLESEFAKSKSGIKAVESMALGIPVIATDSEPYRGIVQDGVTGFLVRYDHEWLNRIEELAADEKLREKMGAAGREAARAWTTEKNWRKWADAYEGLFRR